MALDAFCGEVHGRNALGRIDIETPLGRGHFTATSTGTMPQAFQDFPVVQRQGNANVVI
jgi:hypothetical protein